MQNCKFPFKLKTQIVPIASQCCYQTPYLTRIHLMLFLLIFEWFYKISRWFWRIFDIQAKTIPFDAIDKLEKRKNKTPECKKGQKLERNKDDWYYNSPGPHGNLDSKQLVCVIVQLELVVASCVAQLQLGEVHLLLEATISVLCLCEAAAVCSADR